MKPSNPVSLDEQLRTSAQARRATLDAQADAYPVGDYPTRPVVDGVRQVPLSSQPNVLARLAWLLGIGGVTTAGLLGLLTLAVTWSTPNPSNQPIVVAAPRPDVLAASVRSLVTGLHQAETNFGERLDPSISAATAWPAQLGSLSSAALAKAEVDLTAPMDQELAALRADLQTAADYLRQQWRPADNPTRLPGEPASQMQAPSPAATG